MTASTETKGAAARAREQGFAFIIAILSLMLLTFLGLTLAATTSTELQIATNYRWAQQAQYNAEAGLEVARVVLSNVADPASGWQTQLPPARTGYWAPGAAPSLGGTPAGRDYYNQNCDQRGGVGYGLVLTEGATRYEEISNFQGNAVNGAFTIWIRRPLLVANDGQYADETRNDTLIVVSEGVAPYTGGGSAFTRARQATRVLETRFGLALSTVGNPCGLGKQQGQEGGSPMGENFNPCAPVTAGATGSLANVFGGGSAGALTGTSVE